MFCKSKLMHTAVGVFSRLRFVLRCNLEAEANIQFDNLNGEGANLPGGQILLNSLSLQGIEHL